MTSMARAVAAGIGVAALVVAGCDNPSTPETGPTQTTAASPSATPSNLLGESLEDTLARWSFEWVQPEPLDPDQQAVADAVRGWRYYASLGNARPQDPPAQQMAWYAAPSRYDSLLDAFAAGADTGPLASGIDRFVLVDVRIDGTTAQVDACSDSRESITIDINGRAFPPASGGVAGRRYILELREQPVDGPLPPTRWLVTDEQIQVPTDLDERCQQLVDQPLPPTATITLPPNQ